MWVGLGLWLRNADIAYLVQIYKLVVIYHDSWLPLLKMWVGLVRNADIAYLVT